MTRRESLAARIRKIRGGAPGQWWALIGCPTGGWAETAQAVNQLLDDLPRSEERQYDVWRLIDALYVVDSAGRYQPRP